MARKKKPATPSLRQFGSPIEVMLRNAICDYCAKVAGSEVTIFDYSTSKEQAIATLHDGMFSGVETASGNDWNVESGYHTYGRCGAPDRPLDLYGSVLIGSYKTDFIIGSESCGEWLAIECDGHEWHDRTKQQASADRARDRHLLSLGLRTIRFTGSDIHHYSERCAVEAVTLIRQMCDTGSEAKEQNAFTRGFDIGAKREREKVALADISGLVAGLCGDVG